MAGKSKRVNLPDWARNIPQLALHTAFMEQLDALYSVMSDRASFIELRLKARDDGSCYALCKRADESGTPVVAFGTGLDVFTALEGLEGAIHAGNWRADKPYTPRAGGGGSS